MLQALSTSLGETFRSIIASFRLSSLFPTLCFVALQRYVLLPYLARFGLPLELEEEASLAFFLILTALISYALRYLNFPLIRLIEGYPMRNTLLGRGMIRWHQARRDRLEEQRKHLDGLRKKASHERIVAEAKAELRFIADELGDYYPQRAHVTPTSLGNVMAAFEGYPGERYGIDAVYMWPRILPILDAEKYAPFVDREKEGFDFFINFAVLSALLAFELLVLRFLLNLHPDLAASSVLSILTWSVCIAGGLAYLFYRAAIASALNWGETVKSAFDLYRYELAAQLALERFTDKDDETEKWQNFSYFLKRGGANSFMRFNYPLPNFELLPEEEKKEQKKAEKSQETAAAKGEDDNEMA
jgi:hypothetical protein